MKNWLVCFLGFIILKAIAAQETATREELNKKMLEWHNEFRSKILNCQLEGQPQAKTMPNMVSHRFFQLVVIFSSYKIVIFLDIVNKKLN